MKPPKRFPHWDRKISQTNVFHEAFPKWNLSKRTFSTRLAQKLRMKPSKTSVFHEAFAKIENETFHKTFPKNCKSTLPKRTFPTRPSQKLRTNLPKRTFSTRLSRKVRIHISKTNVFHETFYKLQNFTRTSCQKNYEHEPCAQTTFEAYKKCNFTCIPRLRHGGSPQRVARGHQTCNSTCIPRRRRAWSRQIDTVGATSAL